MSGALAWAWIQPNHYMPWPSFQAEAWAAGVLLVLGLIVAVRTSQGLVEWHVSVGGALALAAVALLQAASGQLVTPGIGVTAAMYLLGLGIAMLVGARWERAQPLAVADFVFLASAVAALGSVGLQLHQWLELDGLMLLSMGGSPDRPFANVGQPNLLGSLLLWGLLGGVWAVWRGRLRAGLFLVYALVLIVGLVLTGSRTAMLNAVLLAALVCIWRRRLPWPHAPWVALGLVGVIVVLQIVQPLLREQLFAMAEAGVSGHRFGETASTQVRLRIYAMLIEALALKPWWGYGVNQTVIAHVAVAADHAALETVFTSAHNLLLELLLWFGIPVGGLAILGLAAWGITALRRVRGASDVLPLMALVVLVVHAMLELPFKYGFMLWPAGLLMGMLNVRLGFGSVQAGTRAWLGAAVLMSGAYVAALVTNYAEAEDNFRSWRFEINRVGRLPPAPPPTLRFIPQLDEVLWALRARPSGAPDDVVRFWQAFVVSPTLPNAIGYAQALALAHRAEDARHWLRTMDTLYPPDWRTVARAEWARRAASHPEMVAIPWPAAVPR